jgi:hypothetical protein
MCRVSREEAVRETAQHKTLITRDNRQDIYDDDDDDSVACLTIDP